MILALSNWKAHTSATEGKAVCEWYENNCPFMGMMPGLVKKSLGGASGGTNNKDGNDKEENNEFNDAYHESQSDGGEIPSELYRYYDIGIRYP